MYDDIPKVVMPDPMPMPKIDLEFSKKIFPNVIDDDAYLESLKPKPDKDLEKFRVPYGCKDQRLKVRYI